MPKYKLHKNVAREKVLTLLPKPLVNLVDLSSIKEDLVNIAVFPSGRKHVTLSGQVRTLLDDLTELKPLVVVGSVFTQDAADIALQNVDYFFAEDSTFWTDETYLAIKGAFRKK